MTFRQYGLLAAGLLAAALLFGYFSGSKQKEGGHSSRAAEPTPPLRVKEWVKGGPVDIAAGRGRNVYVIEFWATWCMPCRVSGPHLSDLQRKYAEKGLVVVGVTDEDAEVVKAFVEKAGVDMDYAVAIDDARATYNAYDRRLHIKGYPTAFLLDREGMIAWKGHPMDGLDSALAKALR